MSATPEDIGKEVALSWGDGSLKAVGTMVAHSLAPMILIETPDGERIWWRQDMAETVAACEHRRTTFSRVVCGCGCMHTYCDDCGNTLEACEAWRA